MADSSEYPMSRSWAAASRLNLQHYFLTYHFENHLLDPVIPIDSDNLVIGDVCCGTGIWLLSLAQQLPAGAELHAFDISFDQYPDDRWISPSVQRHVYNVLETPPKELSGKFDIINVSLVVTFVSDERIDSVIKGISTLLKPGGYLQWQEIDPAQAEYLVLDSGFTTRFVQDVIPCAWELNKLQPPNWISMLETKMEVNELAVTSSTRPSFDPKLLHASTQLVLTGLEEFIGAIRQNSKADLSTEDALKRCTAILVGAWKEHQETGTSIWVPVVRVVGRVSP